MVIAGVGPASKWHYRFRAVTGIPVTLPTVRPAITVPPDALALRDAAVARRVTSTRARSQVLHGIYKN
jgi:hypothetical protein